MAEEEQKKSQTEQPILQFEEDESSSSSSSEEEDDEDEEEYASDVGNTVYKGESWAGEDASDISPDDNSAEANIKRFMRVIQSRRVQRRIEEDEKEYEFHEDLFDFPRDPENWMEEDLEELWADAPLGAENPGWDPVWADEEDWDIVNNEISEGRDPPIAPFYVPYRQAFPAIPDNHYDISNPKSVIEELDRIEEFLVWGSYIFADGSSYEGTVWDDLAHGKGVYVAEDGLVRYEGEWLQNNMEGHGVVEVEIPTIQPIPGSKLEAKMRAEGQIITRDFMSPEDKEWLEMDIEDSMLLADGRREIPFEENDLWIKIFGSKPEKGRYKYAGQWKHGRMHGCGVYEVNERVLYGRFYFGQLLEDSSRCNADIAGLHAGIAEVAAAKARMFVNKPDGMVWEEKGPYTDPQHPYFYEDDDVWMAPGFINQFYDVPDYWKTYVKEVDQEKELWLNSFYKAPLRIPMPAELEYWWSHDDSPEFVLINKEPEVDPEDPSKLIYTNDPLILHTRTGRLINFTEDEKYGVRLFWQPQLEDGEDVDPEKATFLPLGFDEYYGHVIEEKKKEGNLQGLFSSVKKTFQPFFDGIGKWVEEKKKASEMNLKLIEQELEFIEAQLCLEEEMEDLEMELRRKEEEEEKKASEEDIEEEDVPVSFADQDQKVKVEEGEGEEKEEEEEAPPQSFGFVRNGLDSNVKDDDGKKNQSGKSSKPFASFSLSLMGSPNKLQDSFLSWQRKSWLKSSAHQSNPNCHPSYDMVSFPYFVGRNTRLTATRRPENVWRKIPVMHSVAKVKLKPHSVKLPENQTSDILSLCIPLQSMMLNQDGMLMSSC